MRGEGGARGGESGREGAEAVERRVQRLGRRAARCRLSAPVAGGGVPRRAGGPQPHAAREKGGGARSGGRGPRGPQLGAPPPPPERAAGGRTGKQKLPSPAFANSAAAPGASSRPFSAWGRGDGGGECATAGRRVSASGAEGARHRPRPRALGARREAAPAGGRRRGPPRAAAVAWRPSAGRPAPVPRLRFARRLVDGTHAEPLGQRLRHRGGRAAAGPLAQASEGRPCARRNERSGRSSSVRTALCPLHHGWLAAPAAARRGPRRCAVGRGRRVQRENDRPQMRCHLDPVDHPRLAPHARDWSHRWGTYHHQSHPAHPERRQATGGGLAAWRRRGWILAEERMPVYRRPKTDGWWARDLLTANDCRLSRPGGGKPLST